MRSQIIRPQESLVLYSVNHSILSALPIYWLAARFTGGGGGGGGGPNFNASKLVLLSLYLFYGYTVSIWIQPRKK
jgi:hypothetical protein